MASYSQGQPRMFKQLDPKAVPLNLPREELAFGGCAVDGTKFQSLEGCSTLSMAGHDLDNVLGLNRKAERR